MNKKLSSFESDLMKKLRNPEFASAYVMTAIVDNDMDFLPIALGDVAKAHGISKLAEEAGINRRTLYKVFDKNGNPSFNLVAHILESLNLVIEVKPKKTKKSKAS
ncbi:MAG: putative addiction module antidote protein [Oligoflexia bacterium]|nr:putative addiction module antidote protein [Oligoflexia bacterium]